MKTPKIPQRPETFSPWKFLEWIYEHREVFAIRKVTPIKDPMTGRWSDRVEILKLSELPPREFAYWAERWFMDATTPIRTPDQWSEWSERQSVSLPEF